MRFLNYIFPTNIYLFKASNKNTSKRCEIYSKFTIKTPERRQSCRSYDVNYVVLVLLLLTLNIFHTFSTVLTVDFEQVNVTWVNHCIFESYRFFSGGNVQNKKILKRNVSETKKNYCRHRSTKYVSFYWWFMCISYRAFWSIYASLKHVFKIIVFIRVLSHMFIHLLLHLIIHVIEPYLPLKDMQSILRTI